MAVAWALAGMRMQVANPASILNLTKEQLLSDYLHDKEIQFCHDSSNDDLRGFLRNRIRLHLLPILKKDYDPGIRGALLKTAANLREDEDLMARSYRKGLAYDCGSAERHR